MKNKDVAFDILSMAVKHPEQSPDIQKIFATGQLTHEDAEELHQLLPMTQFIRQQQAQSLEMQKEFLIMNKENVKNTYASLNNLKKSLDEAMQQAKKGYAYVMWMYVVVFYLGIGLIVTAVVFAAMGKTILAIAFGAIGLIDIVTYLMVKPPLELQASRSNYAQLTAALISWFSDIMNLNGYLTTLPPGTPFGKISEVSDKQLKNTEIVMALIEKYSEPGKQSN